MIKKLDILLASGTEIGCRFVKILNNLKFVNLVLVVTGVDKHKGRGRKVKRAHVAHYCDINNIKVFQSENINSRESIAKLKEIKADIAVVVDFGQIFSKETLNIFPLGSFNLHYSILPDLRGSEPVRCALLNGYKQTGVTLMKMDEKIDTGQIISTKAVRIEDQDNYGVLKEKLTTLSIELLVKFLTDLYNGNQIKLKSQEENGDGSNILFAGKIDKEFCKVNWKLSSKEIVNRIRALSPVPGCWTIYRKKGMRVKIIMATEVTGDVSGKVVNVTNEDFTIGGVKVLKIQPAGRRIMTVREFLAGNPVEVGDEFE